MQRFTRNVGLVMLGLGITLCLLPQYGTYPAWGLLTPEFISSTPLAMDDDMGTGAEYSCDDINASQGQIGFVKCTLGKLPKNEGLECILCDIDHIFGKVATTQPPLPNFGIYYIGYNSCHGNKIKGVCVGYKDISDNISYRCVQQVMLAESCTGEINEFLSQRIEDPVVDD